MRLHALLLAVANSYTLLNIPSVTQIVVDKLKAEVMKGTSVSHTLFCTLSLSLSISTAHLTLTAVMLLPQMDDYELPHRSDCPHLLADDADEPPPPVSAAIANASSAAREMGTAATPPTPTANNNASGIAPANSGAGIKKVRLRFSEKRRASS